MFKNQVLIILFSLGLAGMLFAIMVILSKPPELPQEEQSNTVKPVQDERILLPRRSSQSSTNSGGVRLCNPNYSGCLLDDIGDYDCDGSGGDGPNYTGKVEVLGTDIFYLDKDQNGLACDE
ncbi:MAG: hypothetical protein HYT93_04690 [Parcubacteria group bacterium]|nr:hypothetical protein [Parcubacteria group bacterium]